jgi:preprotein translocase subunit SecE
MDKIINYVKESFQEMKKVTWPTQRETKKYTFLVIGVSLGMAAFLGAVDFAFTIGIEKLLNK